MVNQSSNVLRLESVQDVEEVLSSRVATLGQGVREVLHELGVTFHLLLEVLDAELIELRHHYEVDVLQRHELLLVGKDHLQEIPVDHGIRRDVQLDCNELVYKN